MRFLSLLLLCAFALPLPAQELSEAERKDGFFPLFDGKTFTGWQFGQGFVTPENQPANWKVEDGVIRLSGGGKPNIGSQWDFENFEFRLQWRGLRANYNSGVYIRSGRNVGANQINLAKGSEGVFLGKLEGAKKVPELQKPAMEWNEWQIICEDSNVKFRCNGELAWTGMGLKPAKGYVGMQAEGAPLEFRNLRVREIDYRLLTELRDQSMRDFVVRFEWKCEPGSAATIRIGSETIPLNDGKKAEHPAGEWNFAELRRTGKQYSLWQNGLMVQPKGELSEPGMVTLSLQTKDAKAAFRHIRLREVSSK